MMRWLINGEVGDSIAADDRGLAYGDGLFETIAVRNNKCRFLDAHLARLAASSARLALPAPDAGLLRNEIDALLGEHVSGTIKIIYTRGGGPRGYAMPVAPEPTRMVGFAAEDIAISPGAGVRLIICKTRIGRNAALAGMKTLNRLEQVMARAEWDGADIQEGLMLDDRDNVVCGTMSNLFLVQGDALMTPRLNESGVEGIMRAQVLDVAAELGIRCEESRIPRALIAAADDAFLTNSRIGMWLIAEIEGHVYARHEISLRIRAALAARGVEECRD